MDKLHIVFDGPPGHEAGRFVECETPEGKGLNAGEWVERPDGLWELQIDCAVIARKQVEELEAALRRLIESADIAASSANIGTMDDAIEQARAALHRKGVEPK